MKVVSASFNNHRREFEIEVAGRGRMAFPYDRADPPPTPEDRIRELFIDPELGDEGVTYVLNSGVEGSVLTDHVLEYNRDPGQMRKLILYDLTVAAQRRMEESSVGMRALSRRLRTSPAQLYRLLDPANDRKTIDSMLELLEVLDARVEVNIL
jgi:hypothetical protein